MKELKLSFDSDGEVVIREQLLKKEIISSIVIEASIEEVWKVFIDFINWAQWNPFIPKVEGLVEVGNKISILVQSPGLKEMTFKTIVFEKIPKQKLVWGGGSLWAGYRGSHQFIIEPIADNKVLFKQVETFEGLMVMFIGHMIKPTAEGYSNMNFALKKYLNKERRN